MRYEWKCDGCEGEGMELVLTPKEFEDRFWDEESGMTRPIECPRCHNGMERVFDTGVSFRLEGVGWPGKAGRGAKWNNRQVNNGGKDESGG